MLSMVYCVQKTASELTVLHLYKTTVEVTVGPVQGGWPNLYPAPVAYNVLLVITLCYNCAWLVHAQ